MTAAGSSLPTGPGGRLPRFGVVDIETSGLSTRRHRILQIALVTVDDGQVVDTWSTFVRLRWPWQRTGPRRVHGIRRADLRGAPRLDDALADLARRLEGSVLTAHNAAFDAAFLSRAADARHVDVPLDPRICTLELSRRLDPAREQSHRLADVCQRYGVVLDRPHDALHDALATAAVLPHLLAAHQVDSAQRLAELYDTRGVPAR